MIKCSHCVSFNGHMIRVTFHGICENPGSTHGLWGCAQSIIAQTTSSQTGGWTNGRIDMDNTICPSAIIGWGHNKLISSKFTY